MTYPINFKWLIQHWIFVRVEFSAFEMIALHLIQAYDLITFTLTAVQNWQVANL